MIIDLNSMIHIPAMSWYNNNFYTVKEANMNSVLLIESRDDSHEHDVYVCEVERDGKNDIVSSKIFLGSAEESREGVYGSKVLQVSLLRLYT